MEITGRNALKALGISLLVVCLLSCIYSLLAALTYADQIATDGIGILFGVVTGIVYTLLIFAGGPTFVISFAILQRLKIR